MVKNPPANAEDIGDVGWIPGLGRSPGEGSGNSSNLAWRIPWREEPGGYSPRGCIELGIANTISSCFILFSFLHALDTPLDTQSHQSTRVLYFFFFQFYQDIIAIISQRVR